MSSTLSAAQRPHYVNGCVNLFRAVDWCFTGYNASFCHAESHMTFYAKTSILMHPGTRFIFMLRDFAELVIGHYNFWCHPALDGPSCTPPEWHDPTRHRPRSSEEFEALVLQGRAELAKILFVAAVSYRNLITGWEALVGPERVIPVSQDDLLQSPSKVIGDAYASAGLPPFHSDSFNALVNTAAAKGDQNVSLRGAKARPGSYGNLTLTDRAREALNGWFADDCVWLRTHRGVNFPRSC